jgi:adenylate cyclase
VDETRLSALIHWLVAGAPGPNNFAELTAEIGRKLQSSQLPVDQFATYKTMMHPELPGNLDYWSASGGVRTMSFTSTEMQSNPIWIGTPPQVCHSSGRMVLCSIGEDAKFDEHPSVKAFATRGYKQMVCLPLHSRYTPSQNVASFSTKRSAGFSDHEIDALRQLQAPIARVTESYVLHKSTVGVLSAYVGRNAGSRVLTGNILRGDTEVIPSVVLFVDIKDFTALSNQQAPIEVIGLLNRFFSFLDNAIRRNGGEILKFMGDGALCIFPTPDDRSAQVAAAASAMVAVQEVREELAKDTLAMAKIQFRAAMHMGDVHYGNIGGSQRLDFTVVGPTVNLAARLLSAASDLGEDSVCSTEITALLDASTRLLGEQTFKGFADPVEIYAVA